MAKKLSKKERARKIERATKLVWDSMQSHLPYTHEDTGGNGNNEFHKKSVKEYAELLQILSELY